MDTWAYATHLLTNVYFYLFGIPALLICLAYYYQDILVYVNYLPKGSIGSYAYLPSRYDLPFEDIWLRTKDGYRIHGWFIRYQDPSLNLMEAYKQTPTIIYFHGNAGNISYLLVMVKEMFRLVKCNIFLVSYRGYGKSEGRPTERGLQLDAEAALDFVIDRNDVNSDKIFLFGRSLGGAVALNLARTRREHIKAIIIENAFTCVPDMMDSLLPYIRHFKYFCRNKWRNIDHVKTLGTLPILFLAAEKDELVPPQMMKQLYEECTSTSKQIQYFANGTHNNTWIEPGYFRAMHKFVHIDNADKTVTKRVSPTDIKTPSPVRRRTRSRPESVAGSRNSSPIEAVGVTSSPSAAVHVEKFNIDEHTTFDSPNLDFTDLSTPSHL